MIERAGAPASDHRHVYGLHDALNEFQIVAFAGVVPGDVGGNAEEAGTRGGGEEDDDD